MINEAITRLIDFCDMRMAKAEIASSRKAMARQRKPLTVTPRVKTVVNV